MICTDVGEGDNHTHATLLGDQTEFAAYEDGKPTAVEDASNSLSHTLVDHR